MKIIDLLDRIANGEELPPKILFHNMIWILKSDLDYCEDYYSKNLDVYLFYNKWALTNNLNDEIEIIEEDNKIKKLSILTFSDLIDTPKEELVDIIKEQRFKINEIIDVINKGDK